VLQVLKLCILFLLFVIPQLYDKINTQRLRSSETTDAVQKCMDVRLHVEANECVDLDFYMLSSSSTSQTIAWERLIYTSKTNNCVSA